MGSDLGLPADSGFTYASHQTNVGIPILTCTPTCTYLITTMISNSQFAQFINASNFWEIYP